MKRHAWFLSLVAALSSPALGQENWELALVGNIMMGTNFPSSRFPQIRAMSCFFQRWSPYARPI